jgi:hypothetical protein
MLTRVLALLALAAGVAGAQGRYAGTFTVRRWRPAPWLSDSGRKAVRPESVVLGRRVTFAAGGVRGPELLASPRAKYEIKDVPPEGLFQGGLTRAAEQARALGFPTATISTLMPGCEFEFHFVSADTGMFALNNVIYTIVRVP